MGGCDLPAARQAAGGGEVPQRAGGDIGVLFFFGAVGLLGCWAVAFGLWA